jgi:hypothetical protein
MKTLTLAMFLSATLSAQPADRARALEDYAFSTGLQAYVYAYPLVLLAANERAFLSSQGMSVNHLVHVHESPRSSRSSVHRPGGWVLISSVPRSN